MSNTNEQHQAERLYGKDIAEWLARWDSGRSVWSISMGGLGPGYEQAIQVLAAEIVRHLIETDASWGEDDDEWKRVRKSLDPIIREVDKEIGFSGAQVGAAISLAAHLYLKGPIAVMQDKAVEGRHIQVSRSIPSYTRQIEQAEAPND